MTERVDVLTLGEAMLAMRTSGPLAAGVPMTASVAGAESNVAIGLARLGHRAAWAGRVGDDEAGSLVVRTLRGEGVDVRYAVDAAPTGILVRRERLAGIARVDYHRRGSAGAALGPKDVLPHLQGSVRPAWLHTTGVTPALSESAHCAVTQAVDACRRSGVRVCLDVNHRTRLWSAESATEALTPLARAADVVVASEEELPLVTADLDELFDAGVTHVAIKRGAEGATLHSRDGGTVERPARSVRAVDVVGAGDAFCAGLLSGLLDELPAEECLDRAVLLGAYAVSTLGDWEGLPMRAELGLLAEAEGAVLR